MKGVLTMTEEMKLKLFEAVLSLEILAELPTYDHCDYFEQAYGAYKVLAALNLADEYIKWSVDKGRKAS